jgi:predicted ArsR family transcriptional regulator
VDAGLLVAEFRRLTGRRGPGAGRPSKLYRRSDREWRVSLPERQYDLVGRILASGIERSRQGGADSLDDALDGAAADAGRALGEAAAPGNLGTFTGVLAEQGFEPRVEDDTVLLANCPFDALAHEHTALVCGLNRSFVQGVADGVGCGGLTARLEPEAGQCCVKVAHEG